MQLLLPIELLCLFYNAVDPNWLALFIQDREKSFQDSIHSVHNHKQQPRYCLMNLIFLNITVL